MDFTSNKVNRNPAKCFFITIPQSGQITKTELQSKVPPYEYILICSELHEDGNPHLHALIKLKKALSKKKMLSYLQTKFPKCSARLDLSITKSIPNAIDYCKKEDPECLEDGSIKLPKTRLTTEEQKLKNAHSLYKYKRKNLPPEYWDKLMATAESEGWFENVL